VSRDESEMSARVASMARKPAITNSPSRAIVAEHLEISVSGRAAHMKAM
jgi:hypothetical protein